MEIIALAEQMWGDAGLPVLCFQVAGGRSALFFHNAAADRLCPGGGSVLDVLPASEAEALLDRAAGSADTEEPLFCHIGGEIYSAVFLDWNGCRVCILHNVTAYYIRIQDRLDEAVMASRAKTNFLSEMSHDIRTPMNAIIGMTELALAQKETPPRILDYLNKIQTASGHMMSIINEVLDMSRIESGKIILQPEEVGIADLLHEILIVAKPQADAGHLTFDLQLGQIDCERIVADAVRFKQICLNLLSNAIKFTPEGGTVTLYIELVQPGPEPRVMMRMYVRDTGIGMSPDFLSRVFMPFEREQSLTISKIQGTGLGTAITRNLVELMNGRISVESTPGKGSCFTVEIPFEAADSHTEIYERALSGRRILLLDELESRAATVTGMAGRIGMAVDWARNPDQVAAFINESVFSDTEYFAFLTVERVEGVEMMSFLPEIRARMGSDFPILLLTADDWTHTEYMFTRAGVDAFIPLPLFPTRLYSGLYHFAGQPGQNVQAAEVRHNYDSSRLLLVEDNELNREIAQAILEMTGVSIETACDGQQALDMFRTSPLFYYDLIFMDLQMPVMNGLESTAAIRALPRTDAAAVPIVAMTANAFVEDVKKSIDAGMNAHISKPLDMNIVFDCLDRFLGRHSV